MSVMMIDAGNSIIKAKIARRERSDITFSHALRQLSESEYRSVPLCIQSVINDFEESFRVNNLEIVKDIPVLPLDRVRIAVSRLYTGGGSALLHQKLIPILKHNSIIGRIIAAHPFDGDILDGDDQHRPYKKANAFDVGTHFRHVFPSVILSFNNAYLSTRHIERLGGELGETDAPRHAHIILAGAP